LKQVFAVLEELSGIPAPGFRIPYWVALGAAYANEALSSLTRRAPGVPLAGVRMAKHKMYFSAAKAIRELGLPQTPPRQALAEAVEWFRRNGYVK
jgi:dihydroflavonol-4-reductase